MNVFEHQAWGRGGAESMVDAAGVWVLENKLVGFQISKAHGNLVSGWNQVEGGQYLDNSLDEYTLKENPEMPEQFSVEEKDLVVEVIRERLKRDSTQSVSVRCANPALGLEIIKTYELRENGHHLAKRIAVKRIDPAGGGLFKYSSRAAFSPGFRAGAYYHVRNERDSGSPFYTKAGDVVSRRKMDGQRGMSQICLVNVTKGFGFGHYKYLVNKRFDLKTALGESYFTPDGWVIAVAADFLDNKTLSAEVHYAIFQGDHVRFHLEYMNLPAYREANRFQSAAWLKDVRFISGWDEAHNIGIDIPVDEFLKIFDKDEPIFGWPISPWTDKMWRHRGDFLDGEIELYPKEGIQEIAALKRVQAACPRVKIGNYSWPYSVGPASQIFINHPEWLVYDEKGKPLALFDLKTSACRDGGETYRPNITNPGFVEYACERVRRLMTKLRYEIYFTDDMSLPRNYPDWKTRTVIQNYHWIDYWRRLRETVKDCGKDKVYFANSFLPDLIGAECGYIESGSRYPWIDANDPARSGRKRWTAVADRIFMAKLYQYDEGRWISPSFWGHWSLVGRRNNDPYYSNYIIGLGLKPTHPGEADVKEMGSRWNSLLSKLPYIDAAYQMRGARIVDANASPCWWRDDGDVETYSLRQGNTSFLSVISHEKEKRMIRLSADAAKLGLEKNKETYLWVGEMFHPWQFTKANVVDPAWRNTRIMDNRFIGKRVLSAERIECEIPVRPELLSVMVMSHTPAWIYSVNGLVSQLFMSNTLDAGLEGQLDYQTKSLRLRVNSRKEKAEIMAYFPAEWGEGEIVSENKQIVFKINNEFGLRCFKFAVGEGKRVFELKQSGKVTPVKYP
ncbi:MAG: hypothetical protein PHV34_02545 [Verrucomicrobiae bacterium]|nr:hypothetical protein [Verrucomicrobiae bacterium]